MSAPTFVYPPPTTGGTPVGGSGTPGTIPVWSTGTTLTNSIITQTGTSRVNIGSGSYAGTSLDGVRLTNGVNSYYTASDGTRTSILGADGSAFVGTLTAHDFQIRAGNAVAATVQQGTLNVGIGTASPVASAKLTLGGAANSSIRLSYQTGGTTEVAFDQMNSATGEFRHSSGVSVGWGGFHTFYTDTAERVRINATSLDLTATTGYGLKLPATPGATGAGTEQILDCYNELTWTPTDASGAGLALTINRARYTKVGGTVIATLDVTYPATASGAAAKINLPESTSTSNIGAVTVGYCSTAATGITGIVVNGRFDLYYGSPSAQVLNSMLSGARVVMSACFIV